MRVRDFTPQDYPMVFDWWKARKFPVLPLEFLPDGKIVENDSGQPICASWLYITNTPLAWMEWIVTNPASNLRDRPAGIECLVDSISEFGKSFGVKRIIIALGTKSLKKILGRKGFVIGDEGMTHMVRSIE